MSTGKTAILFFSRTLNAEFLAKPFGLSKHRFSEFYKFLVRKTLSVARETELPLFEIYSNSQTGDTFNERLLNAVMSVQQSGYENVIVLGNDTFGISKDSLLNAADQLNSGRDVVGKDQHGGVFLLGLTEDGSRKLSQRTVKWRTSSVYRQLVETLDPFQLPEDYIDVNSHEDVKSLLRSKEWFLGEFYRLLSGIFSVSHNLIAHVPSVLLRNHETVLLMRGPPALAA